MIGLADSAGALVETCTYTAFGRRQLFDSSGIEIAESVVGNPYGFTGRRWDEESGLWHYRNRVYSASLGRFLQRDPTGYVDGANLYAYVRNNPVLFTDPDGLMARQAGESLETFNANVVDTLRNIPLIGGMLGAAGDVVAGTTSVALGVVTLGLSGTLSSGFEQIGGGVIMESNILGMDVVAGLVGGYGTIYTTARDVVDVLTFGNAVSDGSLLSAAGNLLFDAIIPDYGWFGGPGWGTTQGREQSVALNWVDYNSFFHDRNLETVPYANTAWVITNYSSATSSQVPPGPIGAAYVLAGTIPFLAADLPDRLAFFLSNP